VASGCAGLTATAGSSATTYQWSDGQCAVRALTTNDAKGLVTSVTYKVNGADRVCGKTSTQQYQGLGYLISDTGLPNCGTAPAVTQPVAGPHHAIHRFTRASCNPSIVIDLFFATGRDHPIIAISYDSTSSTKTGDSRFPYGELRFDGASNDNNVVSGVGWGDKYKFRTTTALKELATTGWEYTEANTIPYDVMWMDSPDAEMGLVQTQSYALQDAGGYDFGGGTSSTKQYWGQTKANGPLPQVQLWAYQLNQYSTPAGTDTSTPWVTTSKRFAWGTASDAVGSATYTGVDGTTRSGKPYFSYALFLVMGKHSEGVTEAQVKAMEAAMGTTLSAQTGTVVTSGPVGAGRTATKTYEPAGYNHVYSTWEVTAAGSQAAVTLTTPGLTSPILVVHGYDSTAAPKVTVDGVALEADKGFYATNDTATKTLWLTLAGTYSGAKAIAVAPGP
jgi:hypothetical protein